MLEYILKQQPKLLDSSEMRSQKLLFPSQVYVVMIKFLVKCFELQMEEINTQAVGTEFLSSAQRMCLLLEHSLAFEGSAELHACASKALVSVGSYLPEVCFLIILSFSSFFPLFADQIYSKLTVHLFFFT